jgi:hypothetical protein
MKTRVNAASGIAAGTVLSVVAITIGLPLFVATALSGSGGPLAEGGGLITEGIPPVAAEAYLQAADAAGGFSPPCAIPAWILAGIGEVETQHGTFAGAAVAANGDVEPAIIGPPLPRLGGDTDNGLWDGSSTIDHAVGPMQFLPATWRTHGRDGNHDGRADPHNLFDATLATAAYLCDAAAPMATEDDWRRGLLAYNHSGSYVDEVLAAAQRYRAPTETLGANPELVVVPGIGATNAAWAAQVRAMLNAAAQDGVTLTGSSYRSPDQQIALRRAHCGTSHFAIYGMPAAQCSPPTARPGTSHHEQGLAIDFDNCSSRATPCHRWLTANALTYGLHPLSTEPWHWSIDGR